MSLHDEYNTSLLGYMVIGNLPFLELNYPNKVDGLGTSYCCWEYSDTPFDPTYVKTDYIKNARKAFNPDLKPWMQPPDYADFFEDGELPTITICAPIFDYSDMSDSIGSTCMDYTVDSFFQYFDLSKPGENGYFIIIDNNGIVVNALEEAYKLLYGDKSDIDRYKPIYQTESKFKAIYDECLDESEESFLMVDGLRYYVKYSKLMYKSYYFLALILYEDITTSKNNLCCRCYVGYTIKRFNFYVHN